MNKSALQLDRVVFFGRTFEEYLKMFALTLADIEGRSVLDCPSGPGWLCRGGQKKGTECHRIRPDVSPIASGLRRIAMGDIESTKEKIANDPNFPKANLETYHHEKRKAWSSSFQDYSEGVKQGRYVPASLPSLPFADGQFDLVLSGTPPFCYASQKMVAFGPGHPWIWSSTAMPSKNCFAFAKPNLRLYPIAAMNSSTEWNPIARTLAREFADQGFRIETKASSFVQTQTEVNLTLILRRP